MKTKPFSIILVIICTLLTASGQFLLKMGLNQANDSLTSFLFNIPLISGLICYGLGMILLIIALRYGELSVLYPIISLSFIWVALLSIYVLAEDISPIKWTGIFIIILGVSLIGVGSKNE